MAEINTKTKFILVLIISIFAASVIAAIHALRQPQTAPSISGVLIQQTQTLNDFTLIDHHRRSFTKQDLLGSWHFVVYGYTYCPDICPMTLSLMARVVERLQSSGLGGDTRVLFYSVDPRRDTPEHLAKYIPYFHQGFIGLTYEEHGQSHVAFEKGLGLVYEIPIGDAQGNMYDEDNYPVNHGVAIYLLNPRGNLQAVFTPDFNDDGIFHFSTDQLYADYVAIRAYLDKPE